MKKIFFLSVILLFLNACETVGRKADKATQKEEEKLSKFLKKTESDIKIEFGKPDAVEITKNQNRVLVYYDSKFKIKCERKFEIDKRNTVVGFSSRNCF
tara:strand:+ start:92 stop:388 length:297 start_codon:yes stop_codon:yes gene_type:complete